MTDSLLKFQQLLRELFQFDCADLDFGIYRIMNYKRGVIEKYITEDLPRCVAEELERGALADQSQAAKELTQVAQQIKKTLGEDALDVDGNLLENFHDSKIGKEYLKLRTKAAGGRGREVLEASIFNHLYAFFGRYYQDGDFISKRRYSKRQRYAIPYNGEEVHLYWANNDQYYVKTAEHFHDYTFRSRGVTVHFNLQAASVEQNNLKGDKRFFLPRAKETVWDEKASRVVIPFEYRPLTKQEEIAYGKTKQQDAIIAEALTEIPKRLKKAGRGLAALTSERHKNSDGESVTFLEHHVRQYTRRNTSDFFIHKDLKGFLSRELDFYLKNEVLNLDEMEAAGEDRAESWFQITRVIKAVGGRIIEFLDQIESFQKMLWEKRKFITETQYCITIGNVDGCFYNDIAACESQWTEWKELLHIDEEETNLFNSRKNKKGKRVTFLKDHPTLVLDTKHFDADFVDQLLASVDDLDGNTDGLLVHSENLHALSLLMERYRGQVECIYIDPPYNTGKDEFVYKDNYQHSSWASMMADRLRLGSRLLADDAFLFVSIDDHEVHNLAVLLRSMVQSEAILPTITWEKRTKAQNTKTARQMLQSKIEYILGYRTKVGQHRFSLEPTEAKEYPFTDNKGRYRKQEIGQMAASGIRGRRTMIYAIRGVMPRDGMQWKLGQDEVTRLESAGRLTMDGGKPMVIIRPDDEDEERYSPFWSHFFDKDTYGTAESGAAEVRSDLGFGRMIETVKPTKLISKLLFHTTTQDSIVCDYFAGSGTSGHAAINLNREDGGQRKFILGEMGDYFDTILLPRIKKVTFTPEWKDGKPKRVATHQEAKRGPRIVKYIRVESYEDTLNNIAFDDSSGQQALGFEDYLLQYMLKWETRASATLLNVKELARPFSYKLHIHADGKTQEKIADVPETFNYLMGLHVQTRRVHDDDGRRYLVYRGRIDHRRVVVIWRETEGWQKADLERDKKFVAERKLTEGTDEVFVNADSFIPSAKALEPVFMARIFAAPEI